MDYAEERFEEAGKGKGKERMEVMTDKAEKALSENWTCHIYVFLAISFYVSLANLFSIILFLICWSPKTLKTKEKQDSIQLIQETV